MASWYYLLKGRPHGPVTTEDIHKLIIKRELQSRDLIYRERDTTWREVQTFADFQSQVTQAAAETTAVTAAQKNITHWVLLARKSDGSGYKQKGPFTDAQIAQMLKSGQVSYTDYVWREGLKEWYKILALPEFHSESSGKIKSPLPPLPTESVIAEITQVDMQSAEQDFDEITRKLELPEDEPTMRVEATGIRYQEVKGDTDINEAPTATKKIRPSSQARRRPAAEQGTARRTTWAQMVSEIKALKKTTAVLAILGVGVFFILAVVLISTFQDRQQLKIPTELPNYIKPNVIVKNVGSAAESAINRVGELAKDTAAGSSARPNAPVAPAAPVPEVKVPPQFLRTSMIGAGSEAPFIKIDTNASRHFSILVTLMADGGDVIGRPSFYRTYRLYSLEDRMVDLKKMGLLPGTYQAKIEIEDFTSDEKVLYATLQPDFKKQQAKYRKQLMFDHNDERFQYIKTTTRFESETYRLAQNVEMAGSLASWGAFYKSWRKNFERIKSPTLSRISTRNRNDFVHAEAWLQLKKTKDEIDQEAKNLNRGRLKNEKLDAKKIKELAKTLSKLKEAMIQASLWK